MTMRYTREITKCGNFTWSYDPLELHYVCVHVTKGVLLSVPEEYANMQVEDGAVLSDVLWAYLGECFVAHFTETDGFAERAILSRVFKI